MGVGCNGGPALVDKSRDRTLGKPTSEHKVISQLWACPSRYDCALRANLTLSALLIPHGRLSSDPALLRLFMTQD